MKKTQSRLRFLGIYSWKRTPGKILGIWATIVMTFALLSGTFLISDSMAETVRVRREDSFGAWEIMLGEAHPLLADLAAGNALLSASGRITLWQESTFFPEDAREEVIAAGRGKHYAVGTFDDTALALSHLHLTQGRFPEKEGEVAVVSSCLLNLGFPDEIGQDITWSTPDEEGIYQPCTFTVVGILEDYLANWSVSKNTALPQLLVTEEDGQRLGLQSLDLLMRTNDTYDARSIMADMEPAMDAEAERLTEILTKDSPDQSALTVSLTHNDDAYPEKSKDEVDQLLTRIRILVGMLGIAILFITFRSEVDDRHDTWIYLNYLGAEGRDFLAIVFWEGIAYCLLAIPVALLLALGCTRVLCTLLSDMLGSPILWQVSLPHLFAAMGIGILVSFLGFASGGIKILRIIRNAPEAKPVQGEHALRPSGKKRPLSLPLLSSCIHSLTSAPLRSLGLFLLTFLMASTLMLGTRLIYSEYDQLQRLRSSNSDFKVYYYGEDSHIRKADADAISQFFGVRDVRTWTSPQARSYFLAETIFFTEEDEEEEQYNTWSESGDGFSADLSLYQGSDYYEFCREAIPVWGEPSSLSDFSISLAATDQPDQLQKLIDHSQCREGLTVEDLLTGEEVLLYVPPIVQHNGYIMMENRIEEVDDSIAEPIYEQSAKVGDTITIRHAVSDDETETKTVLVAGILRNPYPRSEETEFSFISPAVYLISGTRFFLAFPSYANGGDSIHQMNISLDTLSGYDAAADTTRSYLRKLAGDNVEIRDYAQMISEHKDNLFVLAGLTTILGGFVLVITVVLYMQLIRSDMDRRRRAIRIYLQLGMTRARIILQEMIPTAILSFLSVALNYVVMCAAYSYYRWQIETDLGGNFRMLWKVGFPNPGAMSILLFVFLFTLLTALLPVIGKTKDNL